jgi:hypothetical protein
MIGEAERTREDEADHGGRGDGDRERPTRRWLAVRSRRVGHKDPLRGSHRQHRGGFPGRLLSFPVPDTMVAFLSFASRQ